MLTYLTIVMLMSISFSVVFYHTTSSELDRQLPPESLFEDTIDKRDGGSGKPPPELNEFFQTRIHEGQESLLLRLISLNLLVLALGTVASYYLSRFTLKPIEEAMESQSQFISDASHELRTPLTALKTTNEVALRKTKLSEKEARKLIELNIEEIINLQNLTEGLLKLLASDAKQISVSGVKLHDIISQSINNVIHQAQAKKISIEDLVKNISFTADKPSIVQVLTILLDNAVKYSPEGSIITLSSEQNKKNILIHVKDRGQGIKAKDLKNIFKRFYRADQSRSKQNINGYGLGLPIAQKIMNLQGGAISVKSEVEKGSTFTIMIPAS